MTAKWIDKDSPVDVVHLDFEKMFDNQRLLGKVRSPGLGKTMANCIETWLEDRKQSI